MFSISGSKRIYNLRLKKTRTYSLFIACLPAQIQAEKISRSPAQCEFYTLREQYFPNKAAIINALATRHLEEFSQRLEAELSSLPQTAEEMALAFDALIEADYQTGLADPAVRDIWQGMAVDKALLEMFTAESHRNVAALTEAARPMVREAERDGLAVSISLMFHFADSAIRVALGKPEAQGRADIERIKSMLRLIWFSMV